MEKDLPAAVLADSLKKLGLKAVEAIGYLEEFNQKIAVRHSKAKQSESQHQDSPHGSPGLAHDQEGRDKAVDEAAWASLRSKLEPAGPAQSLCYDFLSLFLFSHHCSITPFHFPFELSFISHA